MAAMAKTGAARLKSKKYREAGFLISLVIIPVINFCIFWVYVNVDTILMTFQRYNVATGQYDWIWFERYGEVFDYGVQYFSEFAPGDRDQPGHPAARLHQLVRVL